MSTEEKFSIAGYSLKEWAFIILMINLSVVIVSFAVVFWMAVTTNPDSIVISGTIDVSQITTIVFGIALVATVLVSQKLTQQGMQSATAQSDEAWTKNP